MPAIMSPHERFFTHFSPGRRRMSALIELRGVGKTFASGTQALAGLSLAVEAGEFVSLLGPSGCGKSTALRMIAGLAHPSEGEIVRGAGSQRRDTGFVFQEPTLMPWSTVEGNVRLPLRLQGADPAETRTQVEQMLALVGLEK